MTGKCFGILPVSAVTQLAHMATVANFAHSGARTALHRAFFTLAGANGESVCESIIITLSVGCVYVRETMELTVVARQALSAICG